MAVRTILELPFVERPPLELLALDGDRDTIDVDYAGFGWARLDRIWLDGGAAVVPVDDVLLLALHSADDGEVLARDVELEFALPDRPVTVLLSAFLARWLPALPSARAIVLAMCNPHRARLPACDRPLHYGLGDVDAWLDLRPEGDRLRLHADTWRCTEDP